MVENELDLKIKCRRSNRGEFILDYFFKFCEEHCIKREFSIAKTPQQNGVEERINRTIK